MSKQIMYFLLKTIYRKCLKIRRVPQACQPWIIKAYCLCQGLIVIGVLALACFLTNSQLEYNQIESFHPTCKIKFDARYVKPLNTQLKAYSCPQTGIQLIDYQFNILYIKNVQIVRLYNIECFYNDNSSVVWKEISKPTTILSSMVYVQCFRKNRMVYNDMFPLIPSDSKNAKVNNQTCDDSRMEPIKEEKAKNVLIITVKGASRKTFLRNMPLTRHAFEKRGSIMFSNFISKGTKTTDSFMALLRNCSELEGNCNSRREFLWEHYQKLGYYTVYLEDSLHYALFKQQLPGFDYRWIDNVDVEQYGNNWLFDQPYCLQNRAYHQVLKKLLLEFVETRNRLFVWLSLNFGNNNEDDLSVLDVFLDGLFRALDVYGLNDFTVLLVSDHGRVIGEYKDVQAHYAERFHPVAYLMLPRGFHAVYPVVHQQIIDMRTQLINHNALYDLMHAFADLRNEPYHLFHRMRKNYQSFGDKEASWYCPREFPGELCPCRRTAIKKSSPLMERLVDYTLDRINDYFAAANSSSDCAPLRRAAVLTAHYIGSLQVYKIRFTVFAYSELRGVDLLEAYVQVNYRRPGHWKCYRLTYTEQESRRRCLLDMNIHSSMRPLCFC